MKKLLLGFTACALIMTSCSKQEMFENIEQNNNQYSFGLVSGTTTRAMEMLTFAPNGGTVGLWARGTAPIVYSFDETLTSTNGTTWATTSPRFAPEIGTVDFLAWWPQTSAAPAYTTGVYSLPYTVKKDITLNPLLDAQSQEDLMGGVLMGASGGGSKSFILRHLLSQVNFGVYGYKGAQIEITKITVNVVNETGTYTFATGGGAWSALSGTQDYGYTIKGGAVPNAAAQANDITTGDKFIFGDGGKYGPGRIAGTWYPQANGTNWEEGNGISPTATNTLNNSLMLLPQPLTAGVAAAYATFDYIIKDVDGNEISTGTDVSFDFNQGTVNAWLQNKRYVYMIDFRPLLDGLLNTFTVTVIEWENYNNGGIDDGIVRDSEFKWVFNQAAATLTNVLDGTVINNVTRIPPNGTLLTIGNNNNRPEITTLDLRGGVVGGVYTINDIAQAGNGFQGCTNLTTVTLPLHWVNSGSNAFQNCTSLTNVKLHEGLTHIETNMLSGCTALTSVTIPSTVTSIGASAFNGCTGLTSLVLPVGVTFIGNNAFQGCTNLVSINIPAGVQVLGTTTSGGSLFNGCSKLITVNIPDGVTTIGTSMFNNCVALTTITIPASVTNINSSAFNGCNTLATIICLTASEPTIANTAVFAGGPTGSAPWLIPTVTVYAPNGASGTWTPALWGNNTTGVNRTTVAFVYTPAP